MIDNADGLGSFNECYHTTEVWDVPMYSSKMEGTSTEYQGKLCRSVANVLCSCGPSNLTVGIDTTPIYWDSESTAKSRAIASMQFGIQDAGVNLPQFAGELRDFRDIFDKSLGKLTFATFDQWLWAAAKRADNPRNQMRQLYSLRKRQIVDRLNAQSILEGLRTLVASDLFIEFAYKPLVSDLQQMMELSGHMLSQYDRLTRVRPVRVRGASVDRGTSTFSQSGDSEYILYRTHTRITTAWAQVHFDMSAMPAPPSALVAAADALGFDKPISTAWELTPWSFLIDYFVQVGDWLDQFQGDFIELPYTILQQGTSVKTTTDVICKTSFWKNYASGKYVNVRPCTRIGTVSKTKYHRKPEVLALYGAPLTPKLKLPNERQFRNMVDIAFLRLTPG